MKRTTSHTDYCRTTKDFSHRTMREIKQGPPTQNSDQKQPRIVQSHLIKPRFSAMPGLRELEEAKQQAAKYLSPQRR